MNKKTLTLISLLLILLPSVLITAQHQTRVELTPTRPPNAPDLVVNFVKFTLDPTQSCFTAGMPLGTQVIILNQGTAPLLDTDQFEIAVTLNNQTVTRAVNGPIAVSDTLSVWMDDTGTSFSPISVTVDSSNRITESNESNNTWQGQLPIPTPYVACTVTPTPTLTPTASPTPIATPTRVIRFQNGGFEQAESPRNPTYWTAFNLTRTDRQVCNEAGEGGCSFRFSGPSSNGARLLSQSFRVFGFQTDDTLTLSGLVQTVRLEGRALMRLTLSYRDGSRQRLVYPIAEGTTDAFQPFDHSVSLRGKLLQVQLELIAAQSAGGVWFDGLTLR
ncbi:MAG: hypothetical protein MUF87_10520 [Anaerolineae bacterium]|jgi:hypothetical protein|nr:hypothetical protein [Anaerolineae bacterium]